MKNIEFNLSLFFWLWAKFDLHKASGGRLPCYPMSLEQLLKYVFQYICRMQTQSLQSWLYHLGNWNKLEK